MVISRGNLAGELQRAPGRTMPACPLGTKYQHRGGGLGGGDITKMSENVTHLIIYAPRPPPSPTASLQPLTSRFHCQSPRFNPLPRAAMLLRPHWNSPLPPSHTTRSSLSPALSTCLRVSFQSGDLAAAVAFSREINLALLK